MTGKWTILLGLGMVASAIGGCADGSQLSKQNIGTVAGAVGGALIGSQIGEGSGRGVAILGGAVLGGLLGHELGARLDEKDKQAMRETTSAALVNAPDGDSYHWDNAETGHSGAVTPTRTYRNDEQQICRDYQQSIEIAGQNDSAHGTACRQADGSWQII